MFKRAILVATLLAAATPALAHTGIHSVSGFMSGFAHPLGGLDHTLAMIGVGLFAAMLGRQALWALPLSFVGMMLVGGMLGMSGIDIPAVEIGIAVSVVALGTVVSLGWRWPAAAAMALVGAFAIFHGHAHGAEIPAGSDATLYSLGFALASVMLHGLGIVFGLLSLRDVQAFRLAGAAIAAAGIFLVFA
jgi:urease accessory protein